MDRHDRHHAALFDLDCTLIDRHQSIAAYAQRFIDDFHAGLGTHDIETVLPVLMRADGGGYRAAERAGDILTGLAWKQAPGADQLDTHWRQHTPVMSVLMEGAIDTLRACRARNLALAIVTNGTVKSQQRKLDALELEAEVDAVVISEAVGCKKPDPRIYTAALDALGVPAEQAIYIGDHPINDVLGATDAGLRAIWLEGSQDWPADRAPHRWVAQTLAEVITLIDQIASD
ncbi:MAG: HAD family hydrolase [Gemmatimonadetes bacterium]|nr:HAD family hydrolase [Gemmatimonadota bacterium]MBT6146936.1 HAD family hydrolase [Gemmatimonadota bacterium]MBT7860850.1 HAD family hydrolase [Gemmatimonadota bacterium]